MNNPSNLSQALESFRLEIQKVTSDLRQKETELKAAEDEKLAIDASIKAKEAEVKQANELAKKKIIEIDRTSRRLDEEIKRLRTELLDNNRKMQEAQKEIQQEAIRASKK